MNVISGVDIGGTHITTALVDLDQKAILRHSIVRKPIDPTADSTIIIQDWSNAIKESHAAAKMKIKEVGIAMPGPFDYSDGVSWIRNLNKYESLYGKNIKALLAAELGISIRKIRFKNDARAFLAGELLCGCAEGYNNVVGITLGTGLGSATFNNNETAEGFLYRSRFKDGVAEDYLSAQWFIREYENQTGEKEQSVKAIADKTTISKTASNLFHAFGSNLAEVLVNNYSKQNPQKIFIGGNIANSWNLFMPALTQTLQKHCCSLDIKKTALGENASLIGACYEL